MQSRPSHLISSRFLLILSSFLHLDFHNVAFLEIFFPEPCDAVSAFNDRVSIAGHLKDSELARIWKEAVTPLRIFFSVKSIRRIEDLNCKLYIVQHFEGSG